MNNYPLIGYKKVQRRTLLFTADLIQQSMQLRHQIVDLLRDLLRATLEPV